MKLAQHTNHKHVAANAGIPVQAARKAVGDKPVHNLIHSDNQEDAFDSANDFEDGEFVAQDFNAAHILVPQATNHIKAASLNISLHNSFELLDNNEEHFTGEVKSGDKDSSSITLDMKIDKKPNMEGKSLGMGSLDHSTVIEVPGKVLRMTSSTADMLPSIPVLGFESGRQTFPTKSSSSLAQGSNIGRRSCPNVTSESPEDTRDPFAAETTVLQPFIAPITTTNELLGQDKRKVQFSTGPVNKNAACMKDGRILSKFWGDEDTDATDSTFDIENDNDIQKVPTELPDIMQYLDSTGDKLRKAKKGRPRKQKSPTNSVGVSLQHKNSAKQDMAVVSTRSQTGSQNSTKQSIPQ